MGGDHCPHQTHQAHQGDEALLWHTHYLDFLSDFMLVEEGRCVGGDAGGGGRAVCRDLLVSLSLALSLSLAPCLWHGEHSRANMYFSPRFSEWQAVL